MRTEVPSPKGHSPQFSAHICCGQMALWIKIPLDRKVGLNPGDFVLDGNPAALPKKGAEPLIIGQCLLRPNGWLHQDAIWYGDRPQPGQPRQLCVRWGPSTCPKRGHCLLWPNGPMDHDATWYGGRRRPRRHCVRWGPSSPSPKMGRRSLPIFGHVYCGQTAEWIKMALGVEEGLEPGHIVLDGDPAPLPKKTGHSPPTISGLSVLWPNG